MSWLSKLFGGGNGDTGAKKKGPDPVDYKGFTIHPNPISEGGAYRVAAKIEKSIDGEVKTHDLIRADLINNFDEALNITVLKSKSLIDQMGDGLF